MGQNKCSFWILQSIYVYKFSIPTFYFQTFVCFMAQGIHTYQDSLSYKLIYSCTCIVNILNISKNILRNVKMCNSKYTYIINNWMNVMFNIWEPMMISIISFMYTYSGIPPLLTPNNVWSHRIGQGESYMMWKSLNNSWIGFTDVRSCWDGCGSRLGDFCLLPLPCNKK